MINYDSQKVTVLKGIVSSDNIVASRHFSNYRKSRQDNMSNLDDTVIKSFIVENNKGVTVQSVTKDACIFIFAYDKFLKGQKYLITAYPARYSRIKKLYQAAGIKAPKELLKKAATYSYSKYNK